MARNADLWAEENNIPQAKKSKTNQLRTGGITQAGIQSDLDQFEDPTAEPESPNPESPPTGQPGQAPGGGGTVPGGTGGGGQV